MEADASLEEEVEIISYFNIQTYHVIKMEHLLLEQYTIYKSVKLIILKCDTDAFFFLWRVVVQQFTIMNHGGKEESMKENKKEKKIRHTARKTKIEELLTASDNID